MGEYKDTSLLGPAERKMITLELLYLWITKLGLTVTILLLLVDTIMTIVQVGTLRH